MTNMWLRFSLTCHNILRPNVTELFIIICCTSSLQVHVRIITWKRGLADASRQETPIKALEMSYQFTTRELVPGTSGIWSSGCLSFRILCVLVDIHGVFCASGLCWIWVLKIELYDLFLGDEWNTSAGKHCACSNGLRAFRARGTGHFSWPLILYNVHYSFVR